MLVFSEQNVIKDPAFSRLDLISCRNLLIYMGPELQKRVGWVSQDAAKVVTPVAQAGLVAEKLDTTEFHGMRTKQGRGGRWIVPRGVANPS